MRFNTNETKSSQIEGCNLTKNNKLNKIEASVEIWNPKLWGKASN